MKKFIKTALVLVIFVLTSSAFAQRIAVLNFNAGTGVQQSEVDGLSGIFNTFFSPKGAEIVERTNVDRIIQEQNFQKSRISNTDMVKLGELLNVSLIVVGDVNIIMDEYNVDVRVVNTQTGTIVVKDGASFSKNGSYREMMKKLGGRISDALESEIENIKKTLGENNSKGLPKSMTTAITEDTDKRERTNLVELHGYLKLYPEELGVFHVKPSDLIRCINAEQKYGYDTWRLPTQSELDLIASNGYLSGEKYMTSSDPEGILLLVTTEEPKKPIAKHEMSLHAGLGSENGGTYFGLSFSFKYKYKPFVQYDIRLLGEVGSDFLIGEGSRSQGISVLPILVGVNYEKRINKHWSFFADLGLGTNIPLSSFIMDGGSYRRNINGEYKIGFTVSSEIGFAFDNFMFSFKVNVSDNKYSYDCQYYDEGRDNWVDCSYRGDNTTSGYILFRLGYRF